MALVNPNSQDFATRASFCKGGAHGIQAELDGVVYDVVPYGADHVRITNADGVVVATMGFENGAFIVLS